MSSMLDSMQNKLTDQLGLTDTAQDKNKQLLYGLHEAPYQSQNYGESSLSPVDKLTNKPAAGPSTPLMMEDVDAINAPAKETFLGKEAGWKEKLGEWLPNASWDKIPDIAPPPATQPRRGSGFKPGKGNEYYNYAGTVTNSTDPLNSQLGQRIVGSQKQLLGL